MLRAGLARVLGGERPPQLLVLDEPTNHLDLDSIAAVEAGLVAYDGALLVVSRDEAFSRPSASPGVFCLARRVERKKAAPFWARLSLIGDLRGLRPRPHKRGSSCRRCVIHMWNGPVSKVFSS